MPFIMKYHYAHRKPIMQYTFGAFINDKLVGIINYGVPMDPQLCTGICGPKYRKKVYELNRLYTFDWACKKVHDLSGRLVSYSLKQLKKKNLIIISYADSGMHHGGYVYQATNFFYAGLSKMSNSVFRGFGKSTRNTAIDPLARKFNLVSTAKYRYIFFAGNKTFKKHCRRDLRYEYRPRPFPKFKHEKHYKMGQMKPVYLRSKKNHKIYIDRGHQK